MASPRSGPRLLHPLSGSNWSTLLMVLTSNGPIPPRCYAPVALALATTLARWPFTTLERWLTAHRIRQMSPMEPPIFILGHWRSGTTHLYNVLSQSPAFGYISPLATGLPWDLLGLATLLEPLLTRALPSHRFIDRIPVHPTSPQEDEVAIANMLPLSYYHGLYFPKRFRENFNRGVFFEGCSAVEIQAWQKTFVYFLQKVSLHQGGKRLLLKNPIHTGRVAMLRDLWPGAKFIHIYRDPYRVFQSMRNFYDTLFRELALQDFDQVAIDTTILDTYPRLMERLLVDTATLPGDEFMEIRFEDFEQNPLLELERLYTTLGLDGFTTAVPYFQQYLDSVQNYQKNTYPCSPETQQKVQKHWQPFIERWGTPTSL